MFKKFLSVFFLLSIVALISAAGVPRVISYQGKITDGSGAGFNGTVTMEFAIYDTVEGGTPLWSEVHTGVTVDHGLFAVMLGTIDTLNLPFDKPYYLQITVDGTVLVPRMLLTASPYAVRAAIADSVPNDHDQDPENEIIDSVFWEPVDTGVVNYSTLRIVEHSVQWDIVIPVAKDSLADNSIGDLADADTTGKFAGAILKYNGTQWVPAPDENTDWDTLGAYVDTASSINRFHDVNTIGAFDGQVLTWIEAAGQWRPMTLPSGADNWGTQTVVSDNSLIGDGTAADTLRVNWDTLGGYYDTLALQTPGAARIEWQNIVDVPDSVLTDGSATNELIDTMVWSPGGLGTNVLMVVEGGDTHFVYIPVNADSLGDNNLGDLGNVNTAGASDGQVLTWVESAGEWRPTTVSGGGGGDNWGTQVVQSDISLNGDGTAADPLRVNWDTLGSYYDTLSLQTPGAAQVEWQNIVNVPESVLTDGDTLNEKISAFEWEPALAENELLIVEGGDSFNVAIPVDEDNLTDNSISDLADVNTAGASDGQVLTWVESAGEWRPTTVSGGGGGDNWGTQVVQSDGSLNGDGTGASPLSVNWDTLGAYYDTLKLQVPGGAKIEWQNIINVPDSVLTDGDTLNEKIWGLEWETLGDSVLLVIEGGDSFTVHIPVARDKLDDNSITDLGDVNTGGVEDGQVLKWFASSGEWRPADDLVAYGDNWGTQVVITDNSLIGDGTIGDTLKVNWDTLGAYYDTLVLQTPGFARIDWQNIVNVPDSVIADGDSTNELIDSMQWRDAGAGTLAVFERHDTVKISIPFRADSLEDNVIGDLGNVSEAGVEDGQVLKWFASAGEWRPANDIGGGLGDNWGTQTVVSDSSLAGDGTASDPLRLSAITDSSLIGYGTADEPLGINFPNIDFVQDFVWEPDSAPEHTLRIVQASGNDDVIIPVEDDDLSDNRLTDLGDVYADTAALNDILVYDGTRWVLHSGSGLIDDINWNDSIQYIVATGTLRTTFKIFNRADTVSFLSYQEDSLSSGIWYGGKIIRVGNVNSKGYGLYASARAYSGLGADTTVSQFYGVYGSAAYGKINYGVYGVAEDVGLGCTGIGVYGRGADYGVYAIGPKNYFGDGAESDIDGAGAEVKIQSEGDWEWSEWDRNPLEIWDGEEILYMGSDDDNDLSYIQAVGDGTMHKLVLNARGGNVGINTENPTDNLTVVGVENDGTHAAVKVETEGTTQSLLMDGNEIDCQSGDLYIQTNSGHSTKFGGKVGIGRDANNEALAVDGSLVPGGNGIYIINAESHGILIDTTDYGIYIEYTNREGVFINYSDRDGIRVVDADDDGVDVSFAADDGIYISTAGNNGVSVSSADHDGFRVGYASNHGVFVNSCENTGALAYGDYAGGMFRCEDNYYDYSSHDFGTWYGGGLGGEVPYYGSFDGVGVWGHSHQDWGYYGFGVAGTGGWVGGIFKGGDHDYGGHTLLRVADSPSENQISYGHGVWGQGGVSGGVFTGGYFGQIVYGKEISSYSEGDAVIIGNSVELHDTGGTQFAVEYHTVSPQPAVYASGYGKLVHGRAEVKFPEGFSAIIDRDKKPVVTVTPIGECNGIHIVRITDKGFEVKENGGGTSDVEFTWIAVGEKVLEHQIPQQVLDKNNHEQIVDAFFNYHPEYDLKMYINRNGDFEFEYDRNGFQSEEDSLRWEEMRQREMREREQNEHRIEQSKNSGVVDPSAVPQKEENR